MSCGFFSLIQQAVAASVRIPVIRQLSKPEQSIIVVTASARLLSEQFFSAVSVDRSDRRHLVGLDDSAAFNSICMCAPGIKLETDDLRDDVVNGIEQVRALNRDVGAVLLECTSLPPYAAEVNTKTGLPVFDLICLHRMAAPRRRAETLSGLHLERDEVKLEPSAFNSVKQRPSDHQQSFELTQLHGTVVGVAERAIADFKSTSQGKVSLEQGQPGTHNDCPQKGWWARQDSNLQPDGYEPSALTN